MATRTLFVLVASTEISERLAFATGQEEKWRTLVQGTLEALAFVDELLPTLA
ncbi:MAG TPA: hypothetical protein VNQ57_08300 [Ureibacillus sp.]|nr:hypothetical protein [Ureibacillus sp.]